MTFPLATETTRNAFLGGALEIEQPARGYRAGVDPVLLAACVAALPGQHVLELGCGVGVASLCLGRRVAGLVQAGLEMQPAYAELARRNAAANGIALEVFVGDLAQPPAALRHGQFDHVIANPPYFHRAAGSASAQADRETALAEVTPLADWIAAAARRLRPRGQAWFIHRAERLPDMLAGAAGRLGSIEVLPLQPRAGRAAGLILVRMRKQGRAAFRLHAPVTMHAGAAHDSDGDDYTPLLRAVLRSGAALPFPGPASRRLMPD